MENKENIIKINCTGTTFLEIKELNTFQGNLKELSMENKNKLKKNIIKNGFRVPIFVWKNNIIDGHQRIKILQDLIKEGYIIDKIPVVELEAENIKDAKKLLLLINSRYGKITEKGLYDFSHDLGIDDFIKQLDFPDINFDLFNIDKSLEFEKEIRDEEIKYYKKIHILISADMEKIDKIKEVIDFCRNIEGLEIETAQN